MSDTGRDSETAGQSDEPRTTGGTVSRRQFLGASSAIGAAAGLSGCSGLIGGGGGEGLTVGVISPTSGAYSHTGQPIINSAELAAGRFDREVAGQDVELVVRDSGTEPDTAVPAVEEMISTEGIDLLVGAFSSSVILALQDVVARNDITYFPVGGTAPQVTGESCNRYTFASVASAVQLGAGAVIADQLDLINSIFVIVSDYAGAETRFEKKLSIIQEQSDLDYEGVTYAPLGGDDFSPYISEARDSGADCVYVTSGGADKINYIKQAISAGLHEEMEILTGTTSLGLADALTDEEFANIIGGDSNFYWNTDNAQEFSGDYMDQYDGAPDYYAGDAFDATMEALNAVDETGTTNADDLIDFLEGRSFSWTRENTQWRACDHRRIQDIFLLGSKPVADREHEQDYYTVEGSIGGEAIMESCDETGCEL